jgi:mycothiol system anti-sigma-R factor
MNCDECLKFMWQYLDGELDLESSGKLLQHLEQCRECFSHAEFERQLKARVRRSCGREQAPQELRERLSRLLRMF